MSIEIWVDPLPYPKNALEPLMSEKTVNIHYEKHQKGYAEKLSALHPESKDLKDIIKESNDPNILNNAGQLFNHNLFWKSLSPPSSSSAPKMFKDVVINFEEFYADVKKHFIEVGKARFGSGWLWLLRQDGYLGIKSTPNGESIVSERVLAAIDLWEHSYYLDYQYDRAKYLENIFELLNWGFIEKNCYPNGYHNRCYVGVKAEI